MNHHLIVFPFHFIPSHALESKRVSREHERDESDESGEHALTIELVRHRKQVDG